ncbi:MAG TPA: 3-deoxy-8-phosphooctulonate synthase [Phycisphaerales bacterium]|nr:3-deoxy-8-phosphooctulonate synthase [Phycisphaerales bacterium]HMP38327.1 3-deoxy-8-phosphooctulonate synthase [Phycisphaerales bacterium]
MSGSGTGAPQEPATVSTRAAPIPIGQDRLGPDQRGPRWVGPGLPLLVIGGPCVLETPQINERIGTTLRDCCAALELPYVFKASFDKANRTSIHSPRGPGMEAGLAEIARLRERLGVPVTTDIHEPAQAAPAAAVVDLLQIPAFLCRQTDLLVAAGATGRPVNVKKGQFMAPAEMANVVQKLREAGARGVILTERGTFFGYHRLVTDFIGLGDLMSLGSPVCFDVTHSTQLPGAGGTATAGRPDRAALLARAAVAAGVDAIFLECHPEPARSLSDSATALPLHEVPALLRSLAAIRSACSSASPVAPGLDRLAEAAAAVRAAPRS